MASAASPSLQLLEQKCLLREVVSRNGVQKNVHVVVKNAPFTVRVGLSRSCSSQLSLKQVTFDVALLYDVDQQGVKKRVDYLKQPPVSFKQSVNATGTQLTLELRIKVLTSQHENSFFRVLITALNASTGLPIEPELSVQTDPYKVISKPERSRKRKMEAAAGPAKKKTLNELLMESMKRIEEQQAQQQKLIQQLLLVPTKCEPAAKARGSAADEFESNFRACFQYFHSLPPEERPSKIRKVVRSLGAKEEERLAEFIDMFLAEGLSHSAFDMKSSQFPSLALDHSHSSFPHHVDFLRSSLTDILNSSHLGIPSDNSVSLLEMC